MQSIARSFRAEAVRLGGVMIKVGQFLSARLDVLPRAITDELTGLQDEVAPESYENIRKVVEKEFNCSLEDKFIEFQSSPIASASIGQVHLARLRSPHDDTTEQIGNVAVKIQRYHIEKIVETDLAALRVVAKWIKSYPSIKKRVNLPALLEEFSTSLYEELDYLHEGKNAEMFTKNFAGRSDILVPGVIWSHTSRRVLTLEYLDAIKITDYSAIDTAGISRAEVAARLLDTYLKQIFEDHFFHADPHPGNLFVKPNVNGDPKAWKLEFVDFGMAGVVPDRLLVCLRDILIALATRDSKRIIKAYQDLGILLPGANLDLLEKATNKVFERFWGKTTPEMMKFHHSEATAFVAEFGELIFDMPFQVPENMILLVRCLGILSGMCTGLYPEFNIWTSLMPYAQKLVESETGGGKFDTILKEIEHFAMVLIGLPRKTDALLTKLEEGRLEVRQPELESSFRKVELSVRKLTAAILFAVMTWAAVQLFSTSEDLPGTIFATGAAISLLWILFGR